MNQDAQWNIRQAVRALIQSGQVDVVALEGAMDAMDLQPFVDYPHRKAVELTADYLLKENKISGPIHAALTASGKLPRILGIDDPEHYAANVQAYRNAAPKLAVAQQQVKALQSEIESRKREVFSSRLLAFDQQVQLYREGGKPLGEYVDILISQIARDDIPSVVITKITPHPQAGEGNPLKTEQRGDIVPASVRLFHSAMRMERGLDFKRVELERSELIEGLTAKLNPQETRVLLGQSVAYRAGQLRYADFYSQLKETCREKGISLSRFPAMEAYVRYVLLADGIDAEKLLKDISLMEKKVYERLALQSEEKDLVARSRQTWLIGKLVDFALTPAEWKEYRSSSRNEPIFDLKSFESFYQEAHARDTAMADNVIRATDALSSAGKEPVVLLVTGGFHAEGMAQQLTDQGSAVVSYVPKIEKVDVAQGSAYLSVFTQEKTPLEQLFQGKKLYLASSPMGSDIRRALLPMAVLLVVVLLGTQIELNLDYADLGGIGILSGLTQRVGGASVLYSSEKLKGKFALDGSAAGIEKISFNSVTQRLGFIAWRRAFGMGVLGIIFFVAPGWPTLVFVVGVIVIVLVWKPIWGREKLTGVTNVGGMKFLAVLLAGVIWIQSASAGGANTLSFSVKGGGEIATHAASQVPNSIKQICLKNDLPPEKVIVFLKLYGMDKFVLDDLRTINAIAPLLKLLKVMSADELRKLVNTGIMSNEPIPPHSLYLRLLSWVRVAKYISNDRNRVAVINILTRVVIASPSKDFEGRATRINGRVEYSLEKLGDIAESSPQWSLPAVEDVLSANKEDPIRFLGLIARVGKFVDPTTIKDFALRNGWMVEALDKWQDPLIWARFLHQVKGISLEESIGIFEVLHEQIRQIGKNSAYLQEKGFQSLSIKRKYTDLHPVLEILIKESVYSDGFKDLLALTLSKGSLPQRKAAVRWLFRFGKESQMEAALKSSAPTAWAEQGNLISLSPTGNTSDPTAKRNIFINPNVHLDAKPLCLNGTPFENPEFIKSKTDPASRLIQAFFEGGRQKLRKESRHYINVDIANQKNERHLAPVFQDKGSPRRDSPARDQLVAAAIATLSLVDESSSEELKLSPQQFADMINRIYSSAGYYKEVDLEYNFHAGISFFNDRNRNRVLSYTSLAHEVGHNMLGLRFGIYPCKNPATAALHEFIADLVALKFSVYMKWGDAIMRDYIKSETEFSKEMSKEQHDVARQQLIKIMRVGGIVRWDLLLSSFLSVLPSHVNSLLSPDNKSWERFIREGLQKYGVSAMPSDDIVRRLSMTGIVEIPGAGSGRVPEGFPFSIVSEISKSGMAGLATSVWMTKLFEVVGSCIKGDAGRKAWGQHYKDNAFWYEWGLAVISGVMNVAWIGNVWWGVGSGALFLLSHYGRRWLNLKTDVKVGVFESISMTLIYGGLIAALAPFYSIDLVHNFSEISWGALGGMFMGWIAALGVHRYFDQKKNNPTSTPKFWPSAFKRRAIRAEEILASNRDLILKALTPLTRESLSARHFAYNLESSNIPLGGLPVVSLGSGDGEDEIYFANRFTKSHIIGISKSHQLVESATVRANESRMDQRVEFQVGDMTEGLPFEGGSVGHIYARLSLHYLTPTQFKVVLADIKRVLAPGGTLFIVVKSNEDYWFTAPSARQTEDGMTIYTDGNEVTRRFFDGNVLKADLAAAGFDLHSFGMQKSTEYLYSDKHQSALLSVMVTKPAREMAGAGSLPKEEKRAPFGGGTVNEFSSILYLGRTPLVFSVAVAMFMMSVGLPDLGLFLTLATTLVTYGWQQGWFAGVFKNVGLPEFLYPAQGGLTQKEKRGDLTLDQSAIARQIVANLGDRPSPLGVEYMTRAARMAVEAYTPVENHGIPAPVIPWVGNAKGTNVLFVDESSVKSREDVAALAAAIRGRRVVIITNAVELSLRLWGNGVSWRNILYRPGAFSALRNTEGVPLGLWEVSLQKLMDDFVGMQKNGAELAFFQTEVIRQLNVDGVNDSAVTAAAQKAWLLDSLFNTVSPASSVNWGAVVETLRAIAHNA